MAFVLRSNVYQLSTTTGDGSTITLLSDTVSIDGVDYGKFSDFMSNGDRTWIKRWMGSAWEELLVEYSSGSLTIISVLASTNGGAQVNWGAGTKRVFCAMPATEAQFLGTRVQGDLIYGGASAWQRLPKGTAGQMLRQNAGLTAPEWVRAPNALLASGTVSNAATVPIVLTSHLSAGYSKFRLHLNDMVPASDGVFLDMDVSTNGGSSYVSSGYRSPALSYTAGTVAAYNNAAQPRFTLTDTTGNAGSERAFVTVDIAVNAASCVVHARGSHLTTNADVRGLIMDGFVSASGVNALRLYQSSGNIASGTWELVGIG